MLKNVKNEVEEIGVDTNIMPLNFFNSLMVLCAAFSLTDELALFLIEKHTDSNVNSEINPAREIVKLIKYCDFVIDGDGEWKISAEARSKMLKYLDLNVKLRNEIEESLRDICLSDGGSCSIENIPSYMKWEVGIAYHTAVFDIEDSLSLYRLASNKEEHGQKWLAGVLSLEQMNRGIISSDRLEPYFFAALSLYQEHRWDESEKYFEKVIELSSEKMDRAISLYYRNLLAEINGEDSGISIGFLQSSLEDLSEDESDVKAYLLREMAKKTAKIDLEKAEKYLFDSMEMFSRTGGIQGEIQSILDFFSIWNGGEANIDLSANIDLRDFIERVRILVDEIGYKDVERSERLLIASLRASEVIGDDMIRADIMKEVGDLLKVHSPNKAERFLKNALEYNRVFEVFDWNSVVSNDLARIFLGRGQWRDAIICYVDALKFASKSGGEEKVQKAISHLGLSYAKQLAGEGINAVYDEVKMAENFAEGSASVLKEIKNRIRDLEKEKKAIEEKQLESINDLADNRLEQGQWMEARRLYSQVIEISERIGVKNQEQRALAFVGLSYVAGIYESDFVLSYDRIKRAERYAGKSRSVKRRVGRGLRRLRRMGSIREIGISETRIMVFKEG